VVEIMEQLDTGMIEQVYRGGGSPPYPPKMMLALVCKTACKTFQGPGEKSVEKFPPQVV